MRTLFNDQEQRTLHAALDRLIPADDYPGAWEAGCGDYIERQLSGQLSHLADLYHAGLQGIETEARAEYARGFEDLSAEQQDALLARVELGDVRADWPTPPAKFFAAFVNHAAEGYYADPAQGGNRDRVSWRMVGFNGR